MTRLLLFSVVIIVVLINGCKDLGTNPTTISPTYVLMESSFENQGQPSLSNWQDGHPIYGRGITSYSFFNDVPPNGGQWALKIIQPDTAATRFYVVFKTVQPSTMKRYRMTYWYRNSSSNLNYDVTLEAYGGNQGFVYSIMGDSTRWTQDTLIYSSNSFSPDSIIVAVDMFISGGLKDTSKYALFDNFKVEEY